MEDISDANHNHAKRVGEGEYHNLYVQSDTLEPDDAFENLQNKRIETYEIDPAFFPRTRISIAAALKKTKLELE